MVSRAVAVPFVLATALAAQGPPHNGPRPVDAGWYALTGGRVVAEPGREPTPATIVVRNGTIAAVGTDATPPGATEVDCSGLVIYPGLVEAFLPIDVPALDPTTGDVHWNPMIQAQRHALEGAGVPAADREALWSLGFTTAAIAPSGGILKGQSSVVLLDEPRETEPPRVLRAHAYELASLQQHRSGYPSSEMGALALLRQTLAMAPLLLPLLLLWWLWRRSRRQALRPAAPGAGTTIDA